MAGFAPFSLKLNLSQESIIDYETMKTKLQADRIFNYDTIIKDDNHW